MLQATQNPLAPAEQVVNYALRRAIGGDADIRYTDVQAWVAELSGELSPSMVATVYSVLGTYFG